jgi:hypothetical protein
MRLEVTPPTTAHVTNAIQAVVGSVCPYKALEKQKWFMHPKMRKPHYNIMKAQQGGTPPRKHCSLKYRCDNTTTCRTIEVQSVIKILEGVWIILAFCLKTVYTWVQNFWRGLGLF